MLYPHHYINKILQGWFSSHLDIIIFASCVSLFPIDIIHSHSKIDISFQLFMVFYNIHKVCLYVLCCLFTTISGIILCHLNLNLNDPSYMNHRVNLAWLRMINHTFWLDTFLLKSSIQVTCKNIEFFIHEIELRVLQVSPHTMCFLKPTTLFKAWGFKSLSLQILSDFWTNLKLRRNTQLLKPLKWRTLSRQ